MTSVTQLIDFFVPEQYSLTIDTTKPEDNFSGLVMIRGEVTSNNKTIRLHAKDLAIEYISINGNKSEWQNGENDEILIHHPNLTPGRHSIIVSFEGVISNSMHGMYYCNYTQEGKNKSLIATQFESHHAREVFPCIDEPAAKAVFDLTLITPRNLTVLGNQPISSQSNIPESPKMMTIFETTPKMSTYLLAWVIGDLQSKKAQTKNGVDVAVWATPVQSPESLDFALDIAVRSIEFYDEYFGTPYPLKKSDHVALPDFSSGAMENWGLITYREVALLADPKSSSISSRQYIATVIAHELAHQWFGNLVTMKWWNDLWLNESFATLMEYICVDNLEPDWKIWQDFSSNESIIALRRDSLDGVQSVQVDVNHPDEISTLFDGAIVYAKGARLLRMLQNFIGEKAFKEGLKDYFNNFAYQNTIGNDLWECLEKSSHQPIKSMMNTWISQPGYPVITVEKIDNKYQLTQKQFFIGENQPIGRIWPIPITLENGQTRLMTDGSIQIESTEIPLINPIDSAHFIVNYSPELFDELLKKKHPT